MIGFGKIILVGITILIGLAILYFILEPLIYFTPEQVFIHKFTNLASVRNYYTILFAGISTLMGFSGVLLGYYYFFHKLEIDDCNSKLDRSRARINLIIEQLNIYDEYVSEILDKRFDKPKRLSYLRSRIQRGPEIIQALLSCNRELIHDFNKDDIMTILAVFSLVEKSKPISEYNHRELIREDLKDVRGEYIDKIQEARKICYLKAK